MPPTTDQFRSYQVMLDHLNRELFGDQLSRVILNLSRDIKRAVGCYAVKRWESQEQKGDEITLNPDHLKHGPRAPSPRGCRRERSAKEHRRAAQPAV